MSFFYGFADELEKISSRLRQAAKIRHAGMSAYSKAKKEYHAASKASNEADTLLNRIFRRGKVKKLRAAESDALDKADRALRERERKTRWARDVARSGKGMHI